MESSLRRLGDRKRSANRATTNNGVQPMLKIIAPLFPLLLVCPVLSDEGIKSVSEPATKGIGESRRAEQFYEIKKDEGAVGFDYYRFTLIKIGNDIFALHALPDPRYGNGTGITYRWYSTKDGSDIFMSRVVRKDVDGTIPHVEVTLGSGETHEVDYGIGEVTVGRTKLQWSARHDRSGWIYIRNTDKDVSVYREQFDAFADFSGQLDDNRWIRMSGQK